LYSRGGEVVTVPNYQIRFEYTCGHVRTHKRYWQQYRETVERPYPCGHCIPDSEAAIERRRELQVRKFVEQAAGVLGVVETTAADRQRIEAR
jgi:hypothetical protein